MILSVLLGFISWYFLDISGACGFDCKSYDAYDRLNSSYDGGSITIYGYKGASGIQTSMTGSWNIHCSGDYSCYKANSLSCARYVGCLGHRSCQYANDLTLSLRSDTYLAYLTCGGALSCADAVLTGVKIFLQGEISCRNCIINEAEEVSAIPALSLQNSVINSALGGGTMYVEFYGYFAGYNATVNCDAGDTCYIYCLNNGCYQTTLNCDDNCIVSCDDLGTGDNKLHTCPLQNSANSYENADDLRDWIFNLTLFDNFMDIMSTFEEEYDLYCENNDGSSYTVDEYVNTYTVIAAADTPVCCRGGHSCASGQIITAGARIFCSGTGACLYSTFSVEGDNAVIYCMGYDACRGSQFTFTGANGTLYCGSVNACIDVTIVNAKNLHQFGRGGRTLEDTNLYNFTNLYFYTSYIESAVQTENRRGYINITSSVTMSLFLLGYNSGNKLNIICYEGDFCNIYCGGYLSCNATSTIVDCRGTCNIFCNETIGIACPNLNAIAENIGNINIYDPFQYPMDFSTQEPPSQAVVEPSALPTFEPRHQPSTEPSGEPSNKPSNDPSNEPSLGPSKEPSSVPSSNPSSSPTTKDPSMTPTSTPTIDPSHMPSERPSNVPSDAPYDEEPFHSTFAIQSTRMNAFEIASTSELITKSSTAINTPNIASQPPTTAIAPSSDVQVASDDDNWLFSLDHMSVMIICIAVFLIVVVICSGCIWFKKLSLKEKELQLNEFNHNRQQQNGAVATSAAVSKSHPQVSLPSVELQSSASSPVASHAQMASVAPASPAPVSRSVAPVPVVPAQVENEAQLGEDADIKIGREGGAAVTGLNAYDDHDDEIVVEDSVNEMYVVVPSNGQMFTDVGERNDGSQMEVKYDSDPVELASHVDADIDAN